VTPDPSDLTAKIHVVNGERKPTDWYFAINGEGDTGIYHTGDAAGIPRAYVDVDENGDLYVSVWRTDENGYSVSQDPSVGIIMVRKGGLVVI
jgi:hypothetical protein